VRIYKHLDNDWLELALELVVEFFYDDTYLIQKPNLSLFEMKVTYVPVTKNKVLLKKLLYLGGYCGPSRCQTLLFKPKSNPYQSHANTSASHSLSLDYFVL
jgi:hypothetical protein